MPGLGVRAGHQPPDDDLSAKEPDLDKCRGVYGPDAGHARDVRSHPARLRAPIQPADGWGDRILPHFGAEWFPAGRMVESHIRLYASTLDPGIHISRAQITRGHPTHKLHPGAPGAVFCPPDTPPDLWL